MILELKCIACGTQFVEDESDGRCPCCGGDSLFEREVSRSEERLTPVRCLVHDHQYFNGFCLRCGADAILDVEIRQMRVA